VKESISSNRAALMATLVLALLPACKYHPKIHPGVIACTPAGPRCPAGYVCLVDQGEAEGTCGVAGSGGLDADVPRDVAAANSDLGGVVPPDARASEVGTPTGDGAPADRPTGDVLVRDAMVIPGDGPSPDGGLPDVPVVLPDMGTPDVPLLPPEAGPPDVPPPPPDLPPDLAPPDMAPVGPNCGQYTRGPRMVQVGAFCIDTTEVTNKQYRQFLGDTTVSLNDQPPRCVGATNTDGHPNTTFVPESMEGTNVFDTNKDDYPVTSLDWCDAWAFCHWANKRLCGQIGGGAIAVAASRDPHSNQWLNACSQNGAFTYPWGSNTKTGACNVGKSEKPLSLLLSEGRSNNNCVGTAGGPLAQVIDLVGNAEEWIDSCGDCRTVLGDPDLPANTECCQFIGGGYEDPASEANCSHLWHDPRWDGYWIRGFRCCAD
jgi:sulfatase modifying factor 1